MKKKTDKETAVTTENNGEMGSVREFVESIAIALVLAFLFKTFLAELYVIPTGSMAPTLMGRHKDVVCPQCGFHYQVGASDESRVSTYQLFRSTCLNCGYTMDYNDEKSAGRRHSSYSGDRILVGKYPYHLTGPKRWDVAVFLYPGSARMNYIKRVVGLPGETLRIWNGDIYTRPFVPESVEGVAPEFQIARKTPEKILTMMQAVYDNDCQVSSLRQVNYPARWAGVTSGGQTAPTGSTGWTESRDGKEFQFAPVEGNIESGQLAYRHFLPTWLDWEQISAIPLTREMIEAKKPRLITDMVSYNTANEPRESAPLPDSLGEKPKTRPLPEDYGIHWVGDLILECTVDVHTRPQGGKFNVGLVKAGKTFWCNVDLETGEMELTIPANPDAEGQDIPLEKGDFFTCRGLSPMNGVDIYRFRFANVDNQLHVWVNDRLVTFDRPTTYRDLDMSRPQAEDLVPARIGCTRSEVCLSHLKLYRDIYYIATKDGVSPLTDFPHYPQIPFVEGNEAGYPTLSDRLTFYSDPSRWDAFKSRDAREFNLANGQYFMMGDNSAASSDCRIWDSENYVDESLLVGEAYFVYWPHPWYWVLPNISKFRMIH